MEFEKIKHIVNNFANCSIEEIDDVLYFIANKCKEKYDLDFDFSIEFEEGACVKHERNSNGLQQVEIGNMNLAMLKADKELGLPIDLEEEKKEFVELVLSTFHELRHVVQNHYVQDKPMLSEKTLLFSQEKVINDVFSGFTTYNYEQSALEIDAMMFSLIETSKFFESIGINVSKDETFEIMKEKELTFCNYDLSLFGDSYDSALEYFDSIIGEKEKINKLEVLLKNLSDTLDDNQKEDISELIFELCHEKDPNKQFELLKDVSLIVKPDLSETYPLVNADLNKQSKTVSNRYNK